MYNHNKAQQSKNRVHISWDILYLATLMSDLGGLIQWTGFAEGNVFKTKGMWTYQYVWHCSDVIMGAMASQITRFSFVYSAVCSDSDQRKRQCSAPLVFVRGIHRWPVNSPHKGPVTRKIISFDDVIMTSPKVIFITHTMFGHSCNVFSFLGIYNTQRSIYSLY